MPDRVRLWKRLCAGCKMLDQSFGAIAPEGGGEGALADPWACPHCGSTDAIATRPMEDADLDELAGLADGRPHLRLV